MEALLRAGSIYFFLLIIFRIAGRRTLAQLTNFDFVMLLIIGEAVQNGLIGNDFSIIHSALTIVTLIALDIVISLMKQHVPGVERVIDGLPFIIVDHGKVIRTRIDRSRVDTEDILEAARVKMGLERMEQIKYAVLEKNGEISIIPEEARK